MFHINENNDDSINLAINCTLKNNFHTPKYYLSFVNRI